MNGAAAIYDALSLIAARLNPMAASMASSMLSILLLSLYTWHALSKHSHVYPRTALVMLLLISMWSNTSNLSNI